MTDWIWSKRSGGAGGARSALRLRGPAAAAFLRGVPGDFAASASAGTGAGARRRGGFASVVGGFLAMDVLPLVAFFVSVMAPAARPAQQGRG